MHPSRDIPTREYEDAADTSVTTPPTQDIVPRTKRLDLSQAIQLIKMFHPANNQDRSVLSTYTNPTTSIHSPLDHMKQAACERRQSVHLVVARRQKSDAGKQTEATDSIYRPPYYRRREGPDFSTSTEDSDFKNISSHYIQSEISEAAMEPFTNYPESHSHQNDPANQEEPSDLGISFQSRQSYLIADGDVDLSTVEKQRRELQLLIQELKERDRELNEMVASHQEQLHAWEQDRQRVQTLEHQCASLQEEQKLRNGQIRALVKRVRILESNDQSRLTAMESTQQQLLRITEQHSQAVMRIQELQEKKDNLAGTLKKLATRAGQLEAREQELTTLLKLKDCDLFKVQEEKADIARGLRVLEKKQQEHERRETALLSQSADWQAKYHSCKQQLDKLTGDLELSQLGEQGSKTQLGRYQSEVKELRQQLSQAGEREKRKEDLIESQHLKQERTDTELANIRKLYECQQSDLTVLHLNLENTKELLQTQQPHKEENDEDVLADLSDLSASFHSITYPSISRLTTPPHTPPTGRKSNHMAHSTPTQLATKHSSPIVSKDQSPNTIQIFNESSPAKIDSAKTVEVVHHYRALSHSPKMEMLNAELKLSKSSPVRTGGRKLSFSNILHVDRFQPLTKHKSEGHTVQPSHEEEGLQLGTLTGQVDMSSSSPVLTPVSPGSEKLGYLLDTKKSKECVQPAILEQPRYGSASGTPNLIDLSLDGSFRLVNPEVRDAADNSASEHSSALIVDKTDLLLSRKYNVARLMDVNTDGGKTDDICHGNSSANNCGPDETTSLRESASDYEEIAASILQKYEQLTDQSAASTITSNQSQNKGLERNSQSELVSQAISQSVSFLLCPGPPDTPVRSARNLDLQDWVTQANSHQGFSQDYYPSDEPVYLEPAIIDLNMPSKHNEEEPAVIDLNVSQHNEEEPAVIDLNTSQHNEEERVQEISQSQSFQEMRRLYSEQLRTMDCPENGSPSIHSICPEDLSSAYTHERMASPTSELERILAESDATVMSLERSLEVTSPYEHSVNGHGMPVTALSPTGSPPHRETCPQTST